LTFIGGKIDLNAPSGILRIEIIKIRYTNNIIIQVSKEIESPCFFFIYISYNHENR